MRGAHAAKKRTREISSKALSVIMAVVLVLGCSPFMELSSVYAESAEEGQAAAEEESADATAADASEDASGAIEGVTAVADTDDAGSDDTSGDESSSSGTTEDGAGSGDDATTDDGGSDDATEDEEASDNIADVQETGDGVSWYIDAEGVLHLYPTNGESGTLGEYSRVEADEEDANVREESGDYYYVNVPWIAYVGYITSAQITGTIYVDGGGEDDGTSCLFYNCQYLMGVEGLENIVTTGGVNMSYTFYGCSSLKELDLSTWDLSSATSTASMFEGCTALETLQMDDAEGKGWDVSQVVDFSYMFSECSALSSIDVADWDTGSAVYMDRMFSECSGLSELEVGGFDMADVTEMYYMFYYCSGLTTLDVADWDVSSCKYSYNMFQHCHALESLDVSAWKTTSLQRPYAMFADCYVLEDLDVSGWDVSKVTRMDRLFRNCYLLTDFNFSSWDTAKCTRMDEMFKGCTGIVDLDLSSFDTASVTTMYQMFSGCSSLVHLDISGFDMAQVIATASDYREAGTQSTSSASTMGMYQMFYDCSSLASVTLGQGWAFDVDDVYGASYLPTPPTDGIHCGTWVREDEAYGPWTPETLAEKWTTPTSGTTTASLSRYSTISLLATEEADDAEDAESTDEDAVDMSGIWVWGTAPESGELTVSVTLDGEAPATGEYLVLITYDAGTDDESSQVVNLNASNNWSWTEDLEAGSTYTVSEYESGAPEGYALATVTAADGTVASGDEASASGTIETDAEDAVVLDYGYAASGTWAATAHKTLSGGTLAAGDFSFQIAAVSGTDADGNAIEAAAVPLPTSTTASNDAEGSVVFGDIDFDAGDIGCTYVYQVSEVIPNSGDTNYDADIDYDQSVYTYTVTVYDDGDGTLSFDQSVEQSTASDGKAVSEDDTSTGDGTPEFVNEYQDGSLVISKTLSDDTDAMEYADTEFSFRVVLTNSEVDLSDYVDVKNLENYESSAKSDQTSEEEDDGETEDGFSEGGVVESEGLAKGSTILDDDSVVSLASLAAASLSTLAEADAGLPASGTSGSVSWSIDEDGLLSIYPTEGDEGTLGEVTCTVTDNDDITITVESDAPWLDYADSITSVSITGTIHTYDDAGPQGLFCGCSNLQSVEGLGNIVTGQGTTELMSYLFYGCSSLTSLDFTGWDFSRATALTGMFYECSSLATITGIEGWDVADVTNLSYLFYGCSALTELDLSAWDTSSATQMVGVFWKCSGLSALSLCATATDEEAGTTTTAGWDVSKATNLSYIFEDCTSLTALDLSTWSPKSAQNMSHMFTECSSLATLTLGDGWTTESAELMSYMFSGCTALSSLDVFDWDVSGVTAMDYLFEGCESLTELNVSNWNVESATAMQRMFSDCKKVAELKVGGWDVSNVTETYYMFYNCASLSELDVSNWKTGAIEEAYHMFQYCSGVGELDVSAWNTSSMTRIDGIFANCTGLSSIDVSHWDTSKVTRMNYVFYGCTGLTSLDLDGWDTSSVQYMYQMFYYCTDLTELDLSSWDTSSVTSMYEMFAYCTSLERLNLLGFDTSAAVAAAQSARESGGSGSTTGMYGMFPATDASARTTSTLKSVTLGPSWQFDTGDTTSYLPTPTSDSGTWVRTDEEYGPYSAATLASTWTADMSGIWVWGTEDESYTLHFEVNLDAEDDEGDYTGAMVDQSCSVGEDLTVPSANFRYYGHSFTGWNTAADGTGTAYAAEEVVTGGLSDEAGATVTLYAQWSSTEESYKALEFDIDLVGGQQASFTLPANTSYLVYEYSSSGWVLVSSSSTVTDSEGNESSDSEEGTATTTYSGTVASNETTTLDYVNEKTTESTASATVAGVKTLDGDAAEAGSFSFQLEPYYITISDPDSGEEATYSYADYGSVDGYSELFVTPANTTVTNSAGGGIIFDAMSYSSDGVYVYKLTEVADADDDSIDYDDSVVYVIVTVSTADDGSGSMSATVEYSSVDPSSEDYVESSDDESASFANTRKGQLTVSKAVTGTTLSSQTFTVKVSWGDGSEATTVTLNADNNWTWTSGYLSAGTSYTVSETDLPTGYTLASITNGGEGTIEAGDSDQVTVTNSYSASGSWTPVATKTLTGGINLEGGAYSFTLDEGEDTLQTATNEGGSYAVTTESASGSIGFAAISYDEDDVGQTYTYTLSEVVPTGDEADEDIAYDTSTYTVQVSVTDDGDGTLTVTPTYYDENNNVVDSSAVVFTNDYDHEVTLPEAGRGGIVALLLLAVAVLLGSGAAAIHRERNRRAAPKHAG